MRTVALAASPRPAAGRFTVGRICARMDRAFPQWEPRGPDGVDLDSATADDVLGEVRALRLAAGRDSVEVVA